MVVGTKHPSSKVVFQAIATIVGKCKLIKNVYLVFMLNLRFVYYVITRQMYKY